MSSLHFASTRELCCRMLIPMQQMALRTVIGLNCISVLVASNAYVCFLLFCFFSVCLFTCIILSLTSTNNRVSLIRNQWIFLNTIKTIEHSLERSLYKMNVCVDLVQHQFFVLMRSMVHRHDVLVSQPKAMVRLHCSIDTTEMNWIDMKRLKKRK